MNCFASSKFSVTTTPLPPAKTSRFITHGFAEYSLNARSMFESLSRILKSAVGTPTCFITCFACNLDPSKLASVPTGPKQGICWAINSSAKPSQSGASGPTTTRLIDSCWQNSTTLEPSLVGKSIFVANNAVPALPGLQNICETLGDSFKPKHNACSLPPPPMTRTLWPPMSTGRSIQLIIYFA